MLVQLNKKQTERIIMNEKTVNNNLSLLEQEQLKEQINKTLINMLKWDIYDKSIENNAYKQDYLFNQRYILKKEINKLFLAGDYDAVNIKNNELIEYEKEISKAIDEEIELSRYRYIFTD
jgi:hypothetical protein